VTREPYEKPTLVPLDELELADELVQAANAIRHQVAELENSLEALIPKVYGVGQAVDDLRTKVSVMRGLALRLDAVRRLKEEYGQDERP
jgi:uncharacterized protein YoxC